MEAIRSYIARRDLVLNILKEKGKLTLQELKDEFRTKYTEDIPYFFDGDAKLQNWLHSIREIKYELVDYKRGRVYMLKEETSNQANGDFSNSVSSTPFQSKTRSKSVPANEEEEPVTSNGFANNLQNGNRLSRQSRAVKFSDEDRPNAKRSKSEHRPTLVLGTPNIYGSLLIGDDFFIDIAYHVLGFRTEKKDNVLQSGFCVSGQTIKDATERIRSIEDDRYKTAIVCLGSIDVACGRELIHMMTDFSELMKQCMLKNVRPVLCTLAPMPNYLLGNRLDTLTGFNKWLCINPFDLPVIDMYRCFLRELHSKDCFDTFYYVKEAVNVSGCDKPLALWSKSGRSRAYSMIEKNIGLALLADKRTVYIYY